MPFTFFYPNDMNDNASLRQHILDKLHITPSPMQQAVGEAFAADTRPLAILSPTGTGKTLSYLLPLALALSPDGPLQAVVVVPGRELARQSAAVLAAMGTPLRAMACYGGRPAMDEHRHLRQIAPHIIFATPGRLNDHIAKANIDVAGVTHVVIDEYDKCLALGFHDEMERLLAALPATARRILLSATPAGVFADGKLVPAGFRLLNFLPQGTEDGAPARVDTFRVLSPEKDKLSTLRRLLLAMGQQTTMVFVNHRESAERTARDLAAAGFAVSLYHGGLDQKEREAALYRFANGSTLVLVATDLAARGLDIPRVANIVHYHLPESRDAYIHRIGRTARWDRHGRTFFILAPGEALPPYVDGADDFQAADTGASPAQPPMATLYIGKGRRDKISRADILGFLCKTAGLDGADIGRIDVRERYAYAAVRRERLHDVLARTQNAKIKGRRTIVEMAEG